MENNNLIVKNWDEELFLSSKKEWGQLLENSDADLLFMSWQWMSHWWTSLGSRPSDKLHIIAVYLKNELVGLAPLYISEGAYLKGFLSIKRLQFLGSRYSGGGGTRTENLGTIVKKGLEVEVNTALDQAIFKNREWDELVLSDIVRGENFHKLIINGTNDNRLRTRKLVSDDSYTVKTQDSFSGYLESRGKSTRLKLFNRRKVLAEYGEISLEYVDIRKSDDIFKFINECHLVRFGKPIFSQLNIAMLRKVIDSLPESAHFKCSSLLKVNKRVVSAIVNIFLEGKVYNIQLGFLEDFDKRISLGTLHLGYTIEMAFKSEEIIAFNLLAGKGKYSNYKSHLARKGATLESIQIPRKPFLRLLFFVNDKLKGNYEKSVNSQ